MNLNEVIDKIQLDLDSNSNKIKIDLIYAFNGTGKTRISRNIVNVNEEKCLCFNALFQDDFMWDNDSFILNIRKNSWIVKMINEQGFQNQIISNFEMIYGYDIEPIFNSDSDKITFTAKTIDGYDNNVKISKAEETLFIWSIFYTFLDFAISELHESEENRSSNIFNSLKYIIIDDPVSSIDDSIIMKLSIALFDLILKCNNDNNSLKLSFLITTHHALFYNSLYNLIHRDSKIKDKAYVLSKINYNYSIKEKGDTVFGYHLVLKDKIIESIMNNLIDKSHFNMFRILLEKTANYFGYSKYDECLPESKYKQEIIRLLNLYSHGNLCDFEYSELTENEKRVFTLAFTDYLNKYKRS